MIEECVYELIYHRTECNRTSGHDIFHANFSTAAGGELITISQVPPQLYIQQV